MKKALARTGLLSVALAVWIGVVPVTAWAVTVPTPSIIAPSEGQTLCTGSVITISGTADPGDLIALFDVSNDQEFVPPQRQPDVLLADSAGNWSATLTLASGTYGIYARATNPSTSEVSAPSATRNFVLDLADRVTSAYPTPGTFSPANRDGVLDKTTFAAYVASPGASLQFRIYYAGYFYRASPLLPASVGKRFWVWDGKSASGSYVPSRTYVVKAVWRKPGCSDFVRDTSVVVDNAAPTTTSVLLSPSTVFPVRDGYRDYTGIRFALNERGYVQYRVFPYGGTTLLYVSPWQVKPAGVHVFNYSARKQNGSLLPPGKYQVQLFAYDVFGNRRFPSTSRIPFSVSWLKLVTKTTTVVRTAAQRAGAGTTSVSAVCYNFSPSASDFVGGVWMWVQDCDGTWFESPYGDSVAMWWNIAAPSAVKYNSVTASVYGNSAYGSPLGGAFRNWSSGDLSSVGVAWGGSTAWRSFTSRAGSWAVNSGRTIQFWAVLFPYHSYADDWDVGQVRFTISYSVLG